MVMAERTTWVKIDRNILEWEWYWDANTMRVFLHLILKANIKDGRFMGVAVHRGQLITSYATLAKELQISYKGIRTAIKHLKGTGEVAVQPMHDFSLITIQNYDRYQDTGAGQAAPKGQAKGRPGAGQGQQSKNIRKKESKKVYSPPPAETADAEYLPQVWELEIPREFWGRFATEDDWWAFAGGQSDGV